MSASALTATKPLNSTEKLLDTEYPKALIDLGKTVNQHLKWNFVVRDEITDAILEISSKQFQEWIEQPEKPFGSLVDDHTFELPKEVADRFSQVHAVAKKILLPKGQNAETQLADLFKQFQNVSNSIECTDSFEAAAQELYDRIHEVEPEFVLQDEELKEELAGIFVKIFSAKENQRYSNQEIHQKVEQLFRILKHRKQQGRSIGSPEFAKIIYELQIWKSPKDPHFFTDLADFLVKHNPYEKSPIELLLQGIKNPKNLVGKSFNFTITPTPFSLKIKEISSTLRGLTQEITLRSENGESVECQINTETKKFIRLIFNMFVSKKLSECIQQMSNSNTEFQIEFDSSIPGFIDPFTRGKQYTLTTRNGIEGKYIFKQVGKQPYTNYIFTPTASDEDPIIFHVVDSTQQFEITQNGQLIKQKSSVEWPTYQSLLMVSFKKESWFSSHRLPNHCFHLDEMLIRIEQQSLQTNTSLNRSIREKEKCTKQLIKSLVSFPEARKWIDKSLGKNVSKEAFNHFFKTNQAFIELCNNELVKSQFLKEEELLKNIPLNINQQHQLALNMLYQAQLVLFVLSKEPSDVEIEENVTSLVGSSDLISSLTRSMEQVQEMRGKIGIPFMGDTGVGKSTTVGLMMGAALIEHIDSCGRKALSYDKEQLPKGVQVPKIGHNAGISETISPAAYPLLDTLATKQKSRRYQRKSGNGLQFPKGLTKEKFRLIDLAGRFDTRGTRLQVVTSFSVDRAFQTLHKIPALVQVISFRDMEARRFSILMNTLKELENKFPGLTKNNELQKKLHFIITKAPINITIEEVSRSIDVLIREFQQTGELEALPYLLFLKKQILKKQVHVLNPFSKASRLRILKPIVEKTRVDEQDQIKHTYRGSFQGVRMKMELDNSVGWAIVCWTTLLKEFNSSNVGFLDKNRIINENKKLIDKYSAEEETAKQRLKQIEECITVGSREAENQLFQQLQDNAQKKINQNEKDIARLDGEIEVLDREIAENTRAIEVLEGNIAELSTNNTEIIFPNSKPSRGDKVPTQKWNSHVDLRGKAIRAADREDGELSEEEGEVSGYNTETVGSSNFTLISTVKTAREFELVPEDMPHAQKLQKLNEMVGKRNHEIIFTDGWKINISSQGQIEFLTIREHRNGKQLNYSYAAKYNRSPPFPRLTIKASIPNRVKNKIEIMELEQEKREKETSNIQKEAAQAVKQGELTARREELDHLKRSKIESLHTQATKDLRRIKKRIEQVKRKIAGLLSQKLNFQAKAKMYGSSILHHKRLIETAFNICKHMQNAFAEDSSIRYSDFMKYQPQMESIQKSIRQFITSDPAQEKPEEEKKAYGEQKNAAYSSANRKCGSVPIKLKEYPNLSDIFYRPTAPDGNCLIHAIFGNQQTLNGTFYVPKSGNKRKDLAQEVGQFVKDKEVQHLQLQSYDEQNQIRTENINLSFLKTSMETDKQYLGLEHADLIARLHKLNILVFNQKHRSFVFLNHNPNSKDPDHIIHFNGVNHWSKCSFKKEGGKPCK